MNRLLPPQSSHRQCTPSKQSNNARSNFCKGGFVSKLNNYLLDIAFPDIKLQLSMGGHCQISIHGANEQVKNIYLGIKKYCPKNIANFVSGQLRMPKATVDSWLSGYNPIPILKFYELLKIWKITCKKSDSEFDFEWSTFFSNAKLYSAKGGFGKIGLPKQFDEDQAYLIGFILADGHIKDENTFLKNGKYPEYTIAMCDDSKEFLEYLGNLFYQIFGVECNLHYAEDKKGGWYALRCTSKPIYRYFTKVLGIPSGSKTGKITVPEIVKNSSQQCQKAFIGGFSDGEGCVSISTKNPYLEISQSSATDKSPEILDWISQKLSEFGVELSLPQKMSTQNSWRLRTGSKKTINSFYIIISSRHPDKIRGFERVKVFEYGKNNDWVRGACST